MSRKADASPATKRMNMLGHCPRKARPPQTQSLWRQWIAPKLVPCVDHTEARKDTGHAHAAGGTELAKGLRPRRATVPFSA